MTVKTYTVEGMSCKNCKIHVERSIKNIAGINSVMVDVAHGFVRVEGENIDNQKVKQSVEEAGYLYRGEAHNTAKGSDVWLS